MIVCKVRLASDPALESGSERACVRLVCMISVMRRDRLCVLEATRLRHVPVLLHRARVDVGWEHDLRRAVASRHGVMAIGIRHWLKVRKGVVLRRWWRK